MEKSSEVTSMNEMAKISTVSFQSTVLEWVNL
jgi:hypothetical protein